MAKIQFEIDGKSDRFVSAANKAEAAVDKIGRAANSVSEVAGRTTGLITAAITAGVAAIGMRGIKMMVNLGAEVSNVTMAFRNLSSGTQMGGKQLLASMKEMSRGTISELDIMKSANLALQLMGENVADMLPKLTEVATSAAKAQGLEASQMLDDIVRASGRQSVLILDNLGISSTVAKGYMEEYAASLGKTKESLTSAEKSAAFLYATMKAGGDIVKRTGADAETTGDKLQKLNASVANLGKGIVSAMGPAMDYLLVKVTRLVNMLEVLTTRFSQDRAKQEGITNFLTKNQQIILSYERQYQELQQSGAYRNTQEGQNRLADVTGKLRQLYELRDRARKELDQIEKGTSDFKAPAAATPNFEEEKHKKAKQSLVEYYERLGQYQSAAKQREFESYQTFIKTNEGKTALAYNQAAVEQEFANAKMLADIQGARQELDLREQVLRAKVGLESQFFQGLQMFANAGAQLMSSQNKKLFKIGQAAAIANVAVNTSEAITKGYAQLGAFGGTAFAVLMGLVAGVQAGNILKQKPPADLKNETANLPVPVIQAPKFAAGVFDIPRDTFAQIHAGETVIPKNFTDSIKAGEMSLGGGASVVVNIYGDSYGFDDLMGKVTEGLVDIERRSGRQVFTKRVVD